MDFLVGRIFCTCAGFVNKSTVNWLPRRTRSELIVEPGASWANTKAELSTLEQLWNCAGMITLFSSLALEASSTADIAWICAGGLLSGQTLEVWPSLPQPLHQTLVTGGFKMENDVEGEALDPLSFCLSKLFLSEAL